MHWYESCLQSSLVTTAYEQVPDLDPFDIYSIDLDPGISSLDISAFMPALPDNPNPPQGQIAEKAELQLSFGNITQLSLAGVPQRADGRLEIKKLSESDTQFQYRSPSFEFSGHCAHATVVAFGVITKYDQRYLEPRGARLFSHRNVFNTCLLLLEKYGYAIHVSGSRAKKEYPASLQWHATDKTGTQLRADSPIELLGLATLHRHQSPKQDDPYWWRIEGRSILTEVIQEWEQGLD
ncbi:MAG: hypothetical protein CME32_09795 [Gimesia sp.]|nr:hypothetical protein [Gimesia sp.]